MILSHIDSAEVRTASAHRPGGIQLTSLLNGKENSLDNFDLMIIDAGSDYHTPRHRHNFDQIRVMLSGSFEWETDSVQDEGSVGYFSEGTPYKQQGIDASRTLLLQVGGASGSGYMSYAQLQAAIAELQETGSFEEGLFVYKNENGNRRTMDGYQAAWEKVFGKALEYPLPRFNAPVILRPERFAWVKDPANRLVEKRTLGVFNERGLELTQVRLSSGAEFVIDGAHRPYLAYVLSGTGRVNGEAWRHGTAIQVDRNEKSTLSAEDSAELYLFGLPVFDDMQE